MNLSSCIVMTSISPRRNHQDCKIGFQPKIVFETSQRDLMIRRSLPTWGVALLPSRICPNKESNPAWQQVVVRPLVEPEIMHFLYVIWKRGHYLPTPSTALA